MKKCLNCGYERQPRDEGMVPATECPRCGIIYNKIKDGDEGLRDAAGLQYKERKEFQKDSGTFGSEKGPLTEEGKSFPIPKVSIIRSAFIPFLLTLPFIIATVLQIIRSQEIDLSLLIPVFFLTIIWLPFLRRPYEIILVHKQLTFKAPVRNVKVNVGDLTSVRDIYLGFFARFKSKKKSVDAINIREWDELIKIIKSMNPAVEIDRRSKVGRIIGKCLYPVIVTSLICFFGWIFDWGGINQANIEADLAPVIVALEKYKTANNRYPDKLEALTPTYIDALPMAEYYVDDSRHYFHADPGEYKLGRHFTCLPDRHLYNSRTKKWKNEN